MENEIVRNRFIAVTVISLILFLILTAFTLARIPQRTNQPDLTSEAVEGKKLWQHYACVDCHTILGNGAYYAPELTKVYKRRGAPWLKKWLTNPFSVDSAPLMPNLHIQSEEVPKLIAFLRWVNGIDTSGWPPASYKKPREKAEPKESVQARGAELFTDNGCDGCHALKGKGATFGPDLTGEGSRRDKIWLDRWLKDPAAVKPGTAMPKLDLTNSERTSLVEYLASQK